MVSSMSDNIVQFPHCRAVRQPNLWIRASGFGQDAGPLVQRRYISLLTRFNNLGKPLVIDYLDGMAGAAAAHLVANPLADCASMACRVKDLKPSVELAREPNVGIVSMMNRLTKHGQMKDKIHQALEHLLEELGHEHSRYKTVQQRIQRSSNAIGKEGRP